MGFKINDKVVIKDAHTCKSVFVYFNIREMSQFCGRKAKIIDISDILNKNEYKNEINKRNQLQKNIQKCSYEKGVTVV